MFSNDTGQSGEEFVYEWSGSPYEIGFQHGRTLREEIIHEFSSALRSLTKSWNCSEDKALNQFVAQYEPVFQNYVPRAVEEIRGLASGSGLDYKRAFFAATRDGMKATNLARSEASENCTSFSCGTKSTANGGGLLGQTKDTSAPLSRYRIMKIAYSDTGRRAILLNYPGWIANIGLTSQGLAVSANSLYATAPQQDSVPYCLLRRLVLEKSAVCEVLAAIEGLVFENFCMILGDATGHVFCLESVAGQLAIRDVSGRAFGHANSVLQPEFKSLQHVVLGSPSSPTRQENIQRLLDAHCGMITVDTMKQVLSDHTAYPNSICRHPAPDDAAHTTAAFIADLTELEMHIAIGNPCAAPFKTYRLHG